MPDRQTDNWINKLSPAESQVMLAQLISLAELGERTGDFNPLLQCIRDWQRGPSNKTLEEIWQNIDQLDEEASMALALEAQQAARQEQG